MITIRKASDRGHANHGWLSTSHTFSFGGYYDPEHTGFSVLRVMNEDVVAPDKGFGTHPHKNMEIVSLVLEGELEHKDSMGNGAVLKPGELQLISAGSGITHSEFNPSSVNPTHFYQIWIEPQSKNTEPRYEQKSFDLTTGSDALVLVVSPDGQNNTLTINQDVKIYLGQMSEGGNLAIAVNPSRSSWVQVLSGSIDIEGEGLETGDGAAIAQVGSIPITATSNSRLLVFDLP